MGLLDKLRGKAKEYEGKATGDSGREAEGKLQQAKGDAEDALGKAKGAAEDALDHLRDRSAAERSAPPPDANRG
jgi:uncharacterized protein YjbJ (UPF0337 family)